MIRKAINWNDVDKFYDDLYRKQAENFWLAEEIPVTDDIACFKELDKNTKEVFEHILAGLTLLDTEQTSGITEVGKKTDNLFQKSIISLFAGFESIHARSYSTIFQTLCTTEIINELFDWVENTKELQNKVNSIINKYQNIDSDDDLFMAMIGSLCLEGICFYSGFFLPLLLAGQGKMVNSGEIINLILRDEKLHTVGVGFFALEELKKRPEDKDKLLKMAKQMILEVYEAEVEYTKVLYKGLEHLIDDVIKYIQFNVDYTLSCIKLDKHFGIEEKDVNPIVMNGYSIETKTHDFFSTKGNGYLKTTKVEDLSDDDFDDLF